MACSVSYWIEEEFTELTLNDRRLSLRFKKILQNMVNNAQKNISSTFSTWADIKACYRFIKNKKVTSELMLSPHQDKTLERITAEKEQVLLIQDTTYFDYNSREKTRELDSVIRHPRSGTPVKGLMLHNTMAVTTKGIPLGLLDQRYIDRKQFHGKNPGKLRYWNNPIEEKESFRWLQVITDFNARTQGCSNAIHVADREADIYELYRDAVCSNEAFIIRAKVNRSINKNKRREAPKEKLFDTLEKKKAQGKTTITLQVNGKEKYRQACLSIIYSSITIPPPPNKTVKKDGKNLPHVSVQAIMAVERNPPKNSKPIKWLIITNLAINTVEDAIEKVTWYSYRWNIEVFHKILKSGCSIEKAQLRDASGLKKLITLKSIVAWRIFWLARTMREVNEHSCELVLTKQEWQILYRKMNNRNPPKKAPQVKEVYYWIAKLGGYLGRKSDPPPGIISIWRGWTRFSEVIEDYHAFCG
jgi:hypothetical protein